jgi:transposase-like protein
MPLSAKLECLLLTYECPHCRHPITRPGMWFKCVSRFKCQQCAHEVRLSYPEKLNLYERFAGSTDASLLPSRNSS